MSGLPPELRARLNAARLCLLLTRRLCRRPPAEVLAAALRGGVAVVQVREPDSADSELLSWVREVRRAAAGVVLIVNNRPDLAVLGDADGVHVGQDDLPPAEARRIVGDARLVGLSTHDAAQARVAAARGADYVGLGPWFDTPTKGLRGLGAGLLPALPATTLPTFAIGGITAENVAALREAGLTRVAVSGAICGAADPEAAARAILAALGP